jgi:hypothetical protein
MKRLALAALAASVALAAAPAFAQDTTAPAPAPAPADAPAAPPVPVPTEATRHAESVLRATIDSLRAGTADFDKMSPQLQNMLKPKADEVKDILVRLGPVGTVTLLGIDPDQNVVFFRVVFQGGSWDWAIKVEPDGKLSALALRPSPA